MANVKESAIQVLNEHMSALPHEEYGVINMLPFSHDSEQVRLIKRHVCEAIVNLLDNRGFLRTGTKSAEAPRSVQVKCRANGDVLLDLDVRDGVAMVDAASFIAKVSSKNPQCPHNQLTIDDHRMKMQTEVMAEMAEMENEKGGEK